MKPGKLTILIGVMLAWATTKSPFAGTWEGEMNDLPAMTPIVADAGGGSIGVIVTFYFQKRTDDGNCMSKAGSKPIATNQRNLSQIADRFKPTASGR